MQVVPPPPSARVQLSASNLLPSSDSSDETMRACSE
jgi:hypothetical protein